MIPSHLRCHLKLEPEEICESEQGRGSDHEGKFETVRENRII